VRDKDEGDRLRRLSAVMRFLGHLRESPSERDLVHSLLQAAAVWYDLDARSYRRELNGRFALDAWLSGADVTHDPRELDVQDMLAPEGPVHISSLAELEQLGWAGLQSEMLLLPVVVGDSVRRLVVVAGPVEREIEATMMLVCRSAGSVLDHLVERHGRALRDRLSATMAIAHGSFQACVRTVMEEYLAAVGTSGARVAVRPPNHPAVTLFATGEGWATEPVPALRPGMAEVGTARIALAYGLGNEATAVVELLTTPARPFSLDQAHAARVGGGVLAVWLSGVSVGASRTGMDRVVADSAARPSFEDQIQGELARARRLSLSGGVLVASVPGVGGATDPRVVSTVIRTVRAELRSSDLLGQLAGGDIAAVLVRTSADGVARAALRVRERLDELARGRQLPPVVVGHALYPPGVIEPPAALVARARKEAGLVFS
jgi:hypothetical protein